MAFEIRKIDQVILTENFLITDNARSIVSYKKVTLGVTLNVPE